MGFGGCFLDSLCLVSLVWVILFAVFGWFFFFGFCLGWFGSVLVGGERSAVFLVWVCGLVLALCPVFL